MSQTAALQTRFPSHTPAFGMHEPKDMETPNAAVSVGARQCVRCSRGLGRVTNTYLEARRVIKSLRDESDRGNGTGDR